MTRLFIAEKPSVAKVIAAELGITKSAKDHLCCKDGSIVTWCFGHLLEQASPDAYLPDDIPTTKKGSKIWRFEDLPIFPTKWKLLPKKDTKSQLLAIGKLLKSAKTVVNAGDPDREGQLLVDEVLEHFKFKGNVLRFWVSAQDAVSVQRGLKNLKNNKDYQGMTQAAIGRSRADWLLGMNLSRAYTLKHSASGERKLIAVGRVQTPTLAMVATRDAAIKNFKPIPFFEIHAKLSINNHEFVAHWLPNESVQTDSEKRVVDIKVVKSVIDGLVGTKKSVISNVEKKLQKVAQPKPFSLAEIQLYASNRFGFSADRTLSVCQSLYEKHKATTYPRTDCQFLPESQHADAPAVLKALAKNLDALPVEKADHSIKSAAWNDKKITAHHGIIPTCQILKFAEFTEDEKKIYVAIATRYLCQFFPPAEIEKTSIMLKIKSEDFRASGTVEKYAGWRIVERIEDDKDDDEHKQSLPPVKKDDTCDVEKIFAVTKKTTPPKPFTEGTLIKAMENVHAIVNDPAKKKILKDGDGIGTPATRAAIISELKRKGYLETKGKIIVATGEGCALLKVVPDLIKDVALTALFERLLKDVEEGKIPLEAFLDTQKKFIKSELSKIKL